MFTANDAARFIRTVIEAGCTPDGTGLDLSGKTTVSADGNAPYTLLPAVSAALQAGDALVASSSPEVLALCRSLNSFPGGHKLALWDGKDLDCTALLAELEKKSIRTADGALQFLPEAAAAHPALFVSGGRTMLRGGTAGGDTLFTPDGVPWGVLLPEWAAPETFCGTLTDCRTALTEAEQETVLQQLSAAETCTVPAGILIFRAGTELLALCLPETAPLPAAALELYLCTGLLPDEQPDKLLHALCKLPDLRRAAALAETYCAALLCDASCGAEH